MRTLPHVRHCLYYTVMSTALTSEHTGKCNKTNDTMANVNPVPYIEQLLNVTTIYRVMNKDGTQNNL